MLSARRAAILFAGFLFCASPAPAQLQNPPSDTVRVTVSLNADGSRTVYEFDAVNRKAVATTTSSDGKIREKIRYVIDELGRFASGVVYGPDNQFRFKTLYKYDASGQLTQETQLAKDGSLQGKVLYAYDKNGRQTGYSVFDASGKLTGTKAAAAPAPSTPAKKGAGK